MDELKGFVPVVIGLFVFFAVIAVVGGAMSWLASSPITLVLVIAAAGGLIYFWIKRRRARTMV